jgi:hypothetical protein
MGIARAAKFSCFSVFIFFVPFFALVRVVFFCPFWMIMGSDYVAIQGKEIIMVSSFIADSSGSASPTSLERAFSAAGNYQGANRQNLSPATRPPGP